MSNCPNPINQLNLKEIRNRGRFGHCGEPALLGLEIGSAPLVVSRGSNQSRQSSLHHVTFHSSDSHQWVIHRRPSIVEPHTRVVRRRLAVRLASAATWRVLMQGAAKGARVRRRGTETRLFRTGHRGSALVVVAVVGQLLLDRNRTGRRARPVYGEPNGGQWRGTGVTVHGVVREEWRWRGGETGRGRRRESRIPWVKEGTRAIRRLKVRSCLRRWWRNHCHCRTERGEQFNSVG